MVRRHENSNVIIEDKDVIDVLYMNLAGAPDKFNPNGQDGNFWVVLTEEKANELAEKGFNVREFENRDGDTELRLQVFAKFEFYPPNIFMVNSNDKKTKINEEDLSLIDSAELDEINLIISPYHWEFGGKKGVKAYIRTAYFKIVEDVFSRRFSD